MHILCFEKKIRVEQDFHSFRTFEELIPPPHTQIQIIGVTGLATMFLASHKHTEES